MPCSHCVLLLQLVCSKPTEHDRIGTARQAFSITRSVTVLIPSVQVTAQDITTAMRFRQNPIIFLINNGGYTIEVEIHDGVLNPQLCAHELCVAYDKHLKAGPSVINATLWVVVRVATNTGFCMRVASTAKNARHTADAGPYNKIQNWDYVKFIESMDNGNDQSWAVRVCCPAAMTSVTVGGACAFTHPPFCPSVPLLPCCTAW